MKRMITIQCQFKFLVAFSLMLAVGVFQSSAQQATVKLDSITNARLSAVEKKVASNQPGQSHFVVVGLTTLGYVSSSTTSTLAGSSQAEKTSSFGGADTYEFSPMFLWRQGNKVLVEFEPSFNHDGVSVNWATVSYFAAPNVILRGGYLVLPFGMYNKKLAAGWINKHATDPIGLPTGQDYGFEVSGGLPIGSIKWNYDLSVTNGMNLTINSATKTPDGAIAGVGLNTTSRNKTFTGRLGLLPLSNNSLEVGVSALHGGVYNGNPQHQNAVTDMMAFDFNFVNNLSPFQVNIKSQYNIINVNDQTYKTAEDSTAVSYTFTNHSTSGYGQISIRPIESQSNFLKRVELAYRYGNYITPSNSLWGSNSTQVDYSINYWINWRTVVRLTYEILDQKNTSNTLLGPYPDIKTNALHIQFSIQL